MIFGFELMSLLLRPGNKILKIIMSEKMGVSQKKNLDEIEKKVKELIK